MIFCLLAALAITRYHLFGIQVILTELLIGIIALLLIFQIFVAPTIFWKVINLFIFFLFGYLLIKATFREIKRKEEAQMVARRERELRKRVESLAKETKALSRAEDQFLLSIQHHLRTPLIPIRGYLEMILDGSYGEIENSKIKEKLLAIKKSSDTLHFLLEDFLDIHQLRLGKQILNPTKININQLLENILMNFCQLPKAKNLSFILKKSHCRKKFWLTKKD